MEVSECKVMRDLIELRDKGLTVTVPQAMVEASRLRPGTEVDIHASEGAAPALTLDELLEAMRPDNRLGISGRQRGVGNKQ